MYVQQDKNCLIKLKFLLNLYEWHSLFGKPKQKFPLNYFVGSMFDISLRLAYKDALME